MSRTRSKTDELTKQAVLAELEKLRQGRHARYQPLVGRFARCQEAQHAAALFTAAGEASPRAYSRTPLAAPPGQLPPVNSLPNAADLPCRDSPTSPTHTPRMLTD